MKKIQPYIIYITYLIVNVLLIPYQISLFFGFTMGVINTPHILLVDALIFTLFVNAQNLILFLLFFLLSKRKIMDIKHNKVAAVLFSLPLLLVYSVIFLVLI